MKSSLILDIIRAHYQGSEHDFDDAVERLATDEDRKGNSALALEIRKATRGIESAYHEERSRIARPQQTRSETIDDSELITFVYSDESIDDLILEQSVRHRIEEIVKEWQNKNCLPAGIHPSNKILMIGPPGCGKTVTAKALASKLEKTVAYVRLDTLISQFLGQSGANIRKVFDYVKGKNMLLFIDEFDAIGKSRGDIEDVGESKRLLTTLLQNMDLMDEETLLVAATNMPNLLDPAVIRRFDMTVKFPLPDRFGRERLIEMLDSRYGLPNDYDLEAFADLTEGKSYADIKTAFESIVRYVSVNDVSGPLDRAFLKSFLVQNETPFDIWHMRASGMKLREISNITGIPISTLSYRLGRGKHSRSE